jgi:hypothetical protein
MFDRASEGNALSFHLCKSINVRCMMILAMKQESIWEILIDDCYFCSLAFVCDNGNIRFNERGMKLCDDLAERHPQLFIFVSKHKTQTYSIHCLTIE